MSCIDWILTNTQGRKPICTMGVYVVNTNKYMYIHSMSNNLMHIRNTCSRTIRTYIQMLKDILHSDREVATYVTTFVYYFLRNIFCIFMVAPVRRDGPSHLCSYLRQKGVSIYDPHIVCKFWLRWYPALAWTQPFFAEDLVHFCPFLSRVVT